MQSDATYQSRAQILKAMAHPSRLKMLDALDAGERCVCELQVLVGSDLSTVSRHLSVLRSAGLVSSRRERNQIFYKLRVPCVLKTFDCVEAVLEADAREARRRLRSGS
ncbi:MAG TPA: metalloregulator ArsR/SmtB family transcription factor [Anaeromyxobacteraceae bacterium]|jgi:ArsR family transcriptional regulator|nr:metalloregulator ArsR/SmtB family transcription factor [Anaeromyxobacteraceae bacterium]